MQDSSVIVICRANGESAYQDLPLGSIEGPDPLTGMRRLVHYQEGSYVAGLADLNRHVTVASYPYSELLVVHRGRLTLYDGDACLELRAGDSVVIGKNSNIQLIPDATVRFAFFVLLAEKVNQAGIRRIDPLLVLQPSAPPAIEVLTGDVPNCRAKGIFEAAPAVKIGIWDSTPYSRVVRPHKCHEWMHLLDGTVVLGNGTDDRIRVEKGDTVLVVQDAPSQWGSEVYVRKVYAVI
ncbi:cupin domain-containing protein [Pseudomonas sp. XS1P51]